MALSPLDRALRAARRGHHEAARRLLDGVLASDPENEEALSWRARVADSDADRAAYLQRAVAVNPDNRWAAGELAALGDAPGPQPTSDTLSCPNCGGSVEVHPERGAKAVMCTYCGSVLDLTAGQLDILGQMNPEVGPRQPIRPGDEAVFFGETHLVMGWLKMEGWDDEDRWRWDEWQLVSEGGTPRYLSHSPDEGWTIQTPIRPTPEIGSRFGMRWINLPDGKATVHESGPARIRAMQGEFTYRPQLGATLEVLEATRGDQHYSAETTASELEVVGGPRISERELWEAFGRDDKLKEMDARIERRRTQRRALRRAALVCFAACGLFFFGMGYAASQGETFFTTATDFVAQERGLPTPPARPDTRIEVRERAEIGSFVVEAPGETYQATVRAEPAPDAVGAVDAEVYVEDPSGTPYLLASSMRSRGGGQVATAAFKAASAGEHTFVAHVRDTSPERITFSTEVKAGLWSPGPFGVAFGVALLLGVVLFLAGGFGRIQ